VFNKVLHREKESVNVRFEDNLEGVQADNVEEPVLSNNFGSTKHGVPNMHLTEGLEIQIKSS